MTNLKASVDAGNGGTNAIVIDEKGKRWKQFYEASVRARSAGNDGFDLGFGDMKYKIIEWNNQKFVTGDDVIFVTDRGVERHTGDYRYGDEFHQFLVANALAKMGVKNCDVDLTVFAPPGIFKNAKRRIIDGFMAEPVQISINGKQHEWRYNSVTVLPEGIGAAANFSFDEKGSPVPNEIGNGSKVLVVDIGAHTLDTILISDGNFNPEYLGHATLRDSGVNTHIRQPILEALHRKSHDFTAVTVDQVDYMLRRPTVEGKAKTYSLTVAGVTADLTNKVEAERASYARWIVNTLETNFSGLRGIKAVILMGGGAHLVKDHLTFTYDSFDANKPGKGKIVQTKIDPVFANAEGGMRIALFKEKNQ